MGCQPERIVVFWISKLLAHGGLVLHIREIGCLSTVDDLTPRRRVIIMGSVF